MRHPGYRKHASGQARVTIDGVDHLLGPYGSSASKAKYERIISDLLKQRAASKEATTARKPLPPPSSLGQCVVRFLDHAKLDRSEKEYAHFVVALEPVVVKFAGVRVDEYGPKLFKKVREEHAKIETRSRKYVNRLMARIRLFNKWCVGQEYMPAETRAAIECVEPLRKSPKLKLKEAEKVKPVSQGAIESAKKFLPKVVRDMIDVQSLLACRPGELCALTPGMIDRSSDVWEIRMKHHKGEWRDIERTIYVGPQAQAILRPYLLREASTNCFSPAEAQEQRLAAREELRSTPKGQGNNRGYTKVKRSSRRKFHRLPGTAYETGSYGKAIAYACKRAWPNKAELAKNHWSPNQLRHTAGTHVRKKFGIEAAQVILGHSEIGVTQVYAEADRLKAIEVVRKIG